MSLSGGGLHATKARVGLSPPSMVRQPNPVESGFHRTSKGKTSGLAPTAPAPRLDPTPRSRINSRQWTLINGALQRNDFVIRRDNRWKQRGYTDPTALLTLNVHGNDETYFCGFPGEGTRARSNQPDAVKYRKPITKLLRACFRGDWPAVSALLKETPARAQQHTDDNAYPLHVCLARRAPEAVIVALVEIFPDAAKEATKRRRALPLHIACEHRNADRIVMTVADAFPGAAKKRLKPRYDWALPLHLAIGRGLPAKEEGPGARGGAYADIPPMTNEDWGAVLAVLAVYKGAAAKRFRARPPVEWAAQLGAPLGARRALWKAGRSVEVIEALRGHVWACALELLGIMPERRRRQLAARRAKKKEKQKKKKKKRDDSDSSSDDSSDSDDPEELARERAKNERTPMNQWPLHIAVAEHAPVAVVQRLLELYPKACGRRAKFSMWVLGTSTRVGRWRAPVSVLVGPRELECHAHLPAHAAARVCASAPVIEALAACNAAAFETRARGLLPLHVALRKRAGLETVRAVLAAFPRGVRGRTEDGDRRTPLHLAMVYDASVAVVECLLAGWRGAVDVVDAWGHRPVHYALSHHSSLGVVQRLLEGDGHRQDHSIRAIANAFVSANREIRRADAAGAAVAVGGEAKSAGEKEEADEAGGKKVASDAEEDDDEEHTHDQYWNQHWNHKKQLMDQRRWGKEPRVRGAQKKHGGAGKEVEGGEEEEEEEEESSSDSSSSGSSGSDSDDDSDSDASVSSGD